jgi:Ca2+-binding EF-hand superfamily protein
MSYVQKQKSELQSAVNIRTLAADDAVDLVAQAIVTDPEGFFQTGAGENLDDLSFPEFMQACASIVPSFSQAAAQSIFTQLDKNKNDKVSLEELTQTTEVARHFYKESKCESVILAALMPLIAGEQPLKALAELSEDLLRDALVDKVLKALAKQANEVRETLARKEEFETREDEKGLGKFGTYNFGGVAEYDKGLEAVGTPHPNILEHMGKEATKSSDSKDIFRAWNSGPHDTFPEKEWDFVVEPFYPGSMSKDRPPSEWKPKHEYGGKRTPIRLEVFLHALSAMQMASGIRFGDYKRAHELPFENPQWLHVAEVSFVKVVLLRLVNSQLGGVSLLNAFDQHAGLRLTGKRRGERANMQARRIVEALSKALHEKDGSESTCTYEFIVDKLEVLFTPHFVTWQVFLACDFLSKRKHVHNAPFKTLSIPQYP